MAVNHSKEDEIKSEVLASQLQLQDIESDLLTVEKEIKHLLNKQNALLTRKERLEKNINRLQHHIKTKDIKWNTDQHPWSDDISLLLKQRFCLDSLRSLQKETMNVTLSNLDCILIMPTGGGKSLCFQLPALISKGFTLVSIQIDEFLSSFKFFSLSSNKHSVFTIVNCVLWFAIKNFSHFNSGECVIFRMVYFLTLNIYFILELFTQKNLFSA